MNFNARGGWKGKPELSAKVKVDALRFETEAAGSCECRIGAISAHIGAIHFRTAIPFLKPRRRLPLLGTIDGFRVVLKPFDICCSTKGMKLAGVLGIEGMGGHVDARVACEVEGNVEGHLPIKDGRIHIDLEEESK